MLHDVVVEPIGIDGDVADGDRPVIVADVERRGELDLVHAARGLVGRNPATGGDHTDQAGVHAVDSAVLVLVTPVAVLGSGGNDAEAADLRPSA